MPNNVLFKIGLLGNYNISIYDHVCEYICYLFQLNQTQELKLGELIILKGLIKTLYPKNEI